MFSSKKGKKKNRVDVENPVVSDDMNHNARNTGNTENRERGHGRFTEKKSKIAKSAAITTLTLSSFIVGTIGLYFLIKTLSEGNSSNSQAETNNSWECIFGLVGSEVGFGVCIISTIFNILCCADCCRGTEMVYSGDRDRLYPELRPIRHLSHSNGTELREIRVVPTRHGKEQDQIDQNIVESHVLFRLIYRSLAYHRPDEYFEQAVTELDELLTQRRIDINYVDQEDRTPLFLVLTSLKEWSLITHRTSLCKDYVKNRWEVYRTVINLLISRGADVNHLDRYHNTPFSIAAGILGLECEYNNDESGNSYKDVIWKPNLEIIKEMIRQQRVEVNIPNYSNDTPIYQAIRSGCAKTVLFLLDYGVEVEHQNRNGDTPLHLMVNHFMEGFKIRKHLKRYPHVFSMLNVPNIQGDTPFCYASRLTNVKTVKFLIEQGAHVCHQNVEGNAPMHLAAFAGRKDVIKLLFAAGGNIHCLNVQNCTPLLCAIIQAMTSPNSSQYTKIICFFIKRGADVSQKDLHGCTIFDYLSRISMLPIKKRQKIQNLLKITGVNVCLGEWDYFRNPGIKSVDLSSGFFIRREIGDEVAEEIAKELRKNISIISLDLTNNKIGERGVKAIASAVRENNVTLTEINFDRNRSFSPKTHQVLNDSLVRNNEIRKNVMHAAVKILAAGRILLNLSEDDKSPFTTYFNPNLVFFLITFLDEKEILDLEQINQIILYATDRKTIGKTKKVFLKKTFCDTPAVSRCNSITFFGRESNIRGERSYSLVERKKGLSLGL